MQYRVLQSDVRIPCSEGFTLIEVLVATAITGVALGVLMATIAQGHRQSFRGDMERHAGMIAAMIMERAGFDEDIRDSSGEVEGFPGWHYSLELRKPEIRVSDITGEEIEVETDRFAELVLILVPPAGSRHFVVSRLVKAPE